MSTIVVSGDLVRDHHMVQLREDPDYDPVKSRSDTVGLFISEAAYSKM